MLKTKPIEIILTCTQKELKDLSAFIRSPYFNTNKNLVKLFSAVKNNLKKIRSGILTQEDLFGLVFNGRQFNYGIMKNLVSELAAVCEEFLLINSIRHKPENRVRNRVLVADEYDTRRLDKHFYKIMDKTTAELESQPVDNFYFSDRALAEEAKYFFHSSRSDDKALEAAIYDEVIYNLCDFYRKFSRSMWKIDINMANVNSIYEKDFIKILSEKIDWEGLAEEMKGINERVYNNIRLNSLLIKLVAKPDDTKPYFELKKLLAETIGDYGNYEKFSILTKVISYCSTIIKKGDHSFIKETVDIRILMLENVRFNWDHLGPLNFHAFIETVHIYILDRGVKNAVDLLNRYINAVSSDKEAQTRNFCMAYIEEARGNYEKAIEYLKNIEYSDTEIKIWIKRLYIFIFYGMGQYETGFDAVNALRSFVSGKNDLTGENKKRILEFLRIIEKMLKIKCSPEKYSKADVENLHDEITRHNYVLRKWLLKKIPALMQLVD